MFGGSFVVLIWIHVLVPLKVFIKYYSVPKLEAKLPPRMTDQSYATLALTNPLAHVLQVTLNRPEVANAFNTQMAYRPDALF